MLYLNTETGDYPRYIGDLLLLGWEQGTPLPANWVEVVSIDAPELTSDQVAYQGTPVYQNGKWEMSWFVRNLTFEEIQQRDIRLQELELNPLNR